MAYTKTNWVNLETELNPDNMNHIENGIENSYGQFLIAVSDTAPLECSIGDKYYNTTSNKIFTAVGSDTWDSTGEDAELGVFYIVLETQNIYTYDGETLVSVGGGSGSGGGENIPIGTISAFAGDTAPTGYLMCDGSAVSRTTYSELFAAIGTTYGAGDDSTTFNLPNIKGRTIVMQDTDDTDFDTLGETGGEKTHQLTVQELASHSHLMGSQGGTQTSNYYMAVTQNGANSMATQTTGGNQPHNNLQPYIVLNYIIKATMTTGTTSEVVNEYSDSQTDAYSCDYVNDLVEDIYSTTETKTNKKWIDGKPIYRRVFDTASPSSTGSSTTIATIGAFSTLIDLKGNIDLEEYGIVPLPQAIVSNNINTLTIDGKTAGNIKMKIDNAAYSSKSVIVIVEYTKTTD